MFLPWNNPHNKSQDDDGNGWSRRGFYAESTAAAGVEDEEAVECNTYPPPKDSLCAVWWQEKGNKPNYLLSMAVGLTDGTAERPCDVDDERLLADFTQEPYLSLSQDSSYNPRQKILVEEILRRDRTASGNAMIDTWNVRNVRPYKKTDPLP